LFAMSGHREYPHSTVFFITNICVRHQTTNPPRAIIAR
jgi:hypothetical protein